MPWRRVALIATAFALCMQLAFWLAAGEASPFYEYFLWHTAVPNAFRELNLLPTLFGVAVSGNMHQPSLAAGVAASFVQWFSVGALVGVLTTLRLGQTPRSDGVPVDAQPVVAADAPKAARR